MTVQNPAIFLQEGSHPAEDVRRALGSIVGQAGGLVSGSDLAVSENSAGADMSIDVAGGAIWIAGTEATYQGVYYCENRGVTNIPVQAADVVDPRIDLVVARVYDSSYSGTQDEWALDIVTGTPDPSPVAPALPANSFSLATISVAASATTIVDADITDTRVLTDETITGNLVVGGSIDASGGLEFQGTAGYAYVQTLYFTSSGTFTKASYPWLRAVKVTCVGGGGGGSGCGSGDRGAGGGGAGGSTAESFITDISSLVSSVTVTVGTGGAGATGNANAGIGGDSEFDNGGTILVSGTGGDGASSNGVGGHNTTAPTGDVAFYGQSGNSGAFPGSGREAGGLGGSSSMGGGGHGSRSRSASGGNGASGQLYGGGGGGASNDAAGIQNGGSGADGIVVVELYA